MIHYPFDPATDLILDRVVHVPCELVWKAWTVPEHLMPWFCPKPWQTTAAEIDLRPGGAFRNTMCGPNGEVMHNTGTYLEVVEQRRLVFTDALGPGFRPQATPFMTAVLTFTPEGSGTRYHAHVMHASTAERDRHEAMGFTNGWGTALDQLVAYMKGR